MDRNQYLVFRRPYERVLRQLLLELEFFREDITGVNIYSVESRLKTFESAFKKSLQLKIPIAKLQDIAGIRIIVATLEEVEVIVRFFSRRQDAKDLTIIIDRHLNKKEGYRARHLVLEFGGHYARSVYPTQVEIQILTLLQHAFNYISRSWVYKSERTFSDDWQREFLQLAQNLADLDQTISRLQRQVVESSVAGGDDEPLTPFSFQRIVAEVFGEQITLEESTDSALKLIDVGYYTNGQLREFFRNKEVLQLRQRLVEAAHPSVKTWAEDILEWPIHRFYLLFGLNVEASKKFLQFTIDHIEGSPTG